MGDVYSAYDPELGRKVAIKVLRVGNGETSRVKAPQIELEAQAMARLAHPNVVTVFEIDHFGDRPFVAMELVEGATLRHWLVERQRPWREIVETFIAAGRGLAAAHAAGLLHRDFKPDNILIGRDGRPRVADFGLVRSFVNDDLLSAPACPSADLDARQRASGTPRYMSPEQWDGRRLDTRSDQFSYCVALWEALAGDRPYRGSTLAELRAEVALGPALIGASKIPRRLRAILRRGLDPDATRRWPSMDTLLSRIMMAKRRSGIATALMVGALVATSLAALAMGGGDEFVARQPCESPALDPQQVWPPPVSANVVHQTAAAKLIEADLLAWKRARAEACKTDPAARGPKLSCLEGVLARIDAVARVIRLDRDGAPIDAGQLLIDPAVCALAPPPRLMATTSPEFREVVAELLVRADTAGSREPPVIPQPLLLRAAGEPCAAVLAHLLATYVDRFRDRGKRSPHLDRAQQMAQRCGDDRILADTAIGAAEDEADIGYAGLEAMAVSKLEIADAAVRRVSQRDLIAQIDEIRSLLAYRAEDNEKAIAYGTASTEGFADRSRQREMIANAVWVLDLRWQRGTPADVAAVGEELAMLRARAVVELRAGEGDWLIDRIDDLLARWSFSHGDVTGAHAMFERKINRLLRRPAGEPRRRAAGIVVDTAGSPMAGATITAGDSLRGTSASAADGDVYLSQIRRTQTNENGRFDIIDAPATGVLVAELDKFRSAPTMVGDDVRLVLAPTSRVEGRIDLAGMAPMFVTIVIRDASWPITSRSSPSSYYIHTPVAVDGSFSVDGVSRGEIRVNARIEAGQSLREIRGPTLTVRAPVVRGIALSAKSSGRVVHVLVRSAIHAQLLAAAAYVLPGRVPSASLAQIRRLESVGYIRKIAREVDIEHTPREVVAAARPGDLLLTVTDVPEGVVSVCAIGSHETYDESFARKRDAHPERIQMTCALVPEDGTPVTIAVPAVPRLD